LNTVNKAQEKHSESGVLFLGLLKEIGFIINETIFVSTEPASSA